MQRPSVDLPQPDSPTRPSTSPRDLEVDAVDGAQHVAAASRRTASTTLAAEREVHLTRPANLEQRLSHRRSPAPVARPRRTPRSGCTRSRGPLPIGPQRELAATCSPRCTNAQRGWKRQPGGRRGEVGRRARDRRERLADEVEVGHRSRAGRACTGGAARGRPSSTVPVSTTWPAYMTATRWHVCAIDREVVRDEDDADAELARGATRSSFRIWSWIVTSSAVVGSSQRISFGSADSAIAIITRCRMPPESSCG